VSAKQVLISLPKALYKRKTAHDLSGRRCRIVAITALEYVAEMCERIARSRQQRIGRCFQCLLLALSGRVGCACKCPLLMMGPTGLGGVTAFGPKADVNWARRNVRF
jgi:hypothetical protein